VLRGDWRWSLRGRDVRRRAEYAARRLRALRGLGASCQDPPGGPWRRGSQRGCAGHPRHAGRARFGRGRHDRPSGGPVALCCAVRGARRRRFAMCTGASIHTTHRPRRRGVRTRCGGHVLRSRLADHHRSRPNADALTRGLRCCRGSRRCGSRRQSGAHGWEVRVLQLKSQTERNARGRWAGGRSDRSRRPPIVDRIARSAWIRARAS
jgi:hypothetical protein